MGSKISAKNVAVILERLSARYPVVKTQLNHGSPFQLLIATIMSAQCTDNQVNKVTQVLFYHYPDARTLSEAPLDDIKRIIYSTGFYNNKAKNIKACARKIITDFNGVVPEDIKSLVTLPGVGRKTANVVRSVCFGVEAIVVDTHVHRLSRRLGLSDKKDPVKVEFELMEIIPESSWNDISLRFIYFGREICDAKKPLCGSCPLYDICPTRGPG
ncbi:MAG: endonuclease III [Desulfobacterales bacterium]|nr:endonuclease III [Desulfobacterales bacterium]